VIDPTGIKFGKPDLIEPPIFSWNFNGFLIFVSEETFGIF